MVLHVEQLKMLYSTAGMGIRKVYFKCRVDFEVLLSVKVGHVIVGKLYVNVTRARLV